MKLTTTQIQYIHDFVKRKYVDYYDVQIELVDHIATAIEEKIKVNPKLDFYTALQQVYDRFGMFGFSDFVEEKEKQVQRRFRKMQSREWLRFFTVPKVVFTVILVAFNYQILLVFSPNVLKYSFAGVYIMSLLFQIIYLFREQKQ
ncbi:MAG: hypothetical protein ACI9V1_001888 [Spirosomataceae bacterium]|jgi:hypothetical protein